MWGSRYEGLNLSCAEPKAVKKLRGLFVLLYFLAGVVGHGQGR